MTIKIKSKKNSKFLTKNKDGKTNGFLITILNEHEKFLKKEQWPRQVYCTVAYPKETKGPHLHKKRWQLYTCIKGNIKIVIKNKNEYFEKYSGEDYDFSTIQVPAGTPSALVNIGDSNAYILNMPSPAWHIDDQDEWEVAFDDYNFSSNFNSNGENK
ncbi:MAG: cupin domain-containing protein [bacterium]|nr:cupin domain-containing protein [bacterium]